MNGGKVGSEFALGFVGERAGLRYHGIKGHRLTPVRPLLIRVMPTSSGP
jgi:hypothetical protein